MTKKRSLHFRPVGPIRKLKRVRYLTNNVEAFPSDLQTQWLGSSYPVQRLGSSRSVQWLDSSMVDAMIEELRQ